MYPKIQRRQVIMNVLHPRACGLLIILLQWNPTAPNQECRYNGHKLEPCVLRLSFPVLSAHTKLCCFYSHTHTRLMALLPGLPGWAGTRKVKPIWISLNLETVSGSGISWAVCKSAPRSLQTDNHASAAPLAAFTHWLSGTQVAAAWHDMVCMPCFELSAWATHLFTDLSDSFMFYFGL